VDFELSAFILVPFDCNCEKSQNLCPETYWLLGQPEQRHCQARHCPGNFLTLSVIHAPKIWQHKRVSNIQW